MAKLERLYTIPLGDAYRAVRNKRVPRAVNILRTFVARHMKARDTKILISEALNKSLWVRSIQRPPRRVKVRLIKDDSSVRAYLADEKVEEPKKVEEKKPETPKPAAATAPKKDEKPAAKAEPKKEAK